MYYVGIDSGGTFTDTVLTSGDEIIETKTLTTDDLTTGIVSGFEEVCERAGADPDDVQMLNHGSTIAVNTLIEKNGARTALVTTKGFEDVLEIDEGFRTPDLIYDLCSDRNPPLIPRKHRYGITERLDRTGNELTPVDTDEVDEIIEQLEAQGIESVAICFLHSYRNGEHEREVADRISNALPDLEVSLSSEVSPRIREYSRTSTIVADAYIKPKVSSYLTELGDDLNDVGYRGMVNIMNSNGGTVAPHIATRRPMTQVISGPVAGVKASRFVGEQMGETNLLTLDMGGTSCDASIIRDGEPSTVDHRYIHDMKINGPFINISTIGAGGDSIARVDDVGALQVGPESAGADPGPACYGLGGTQPTVTDADLALGILNPENFAGGKITLDTDGAYDAIENHVAGPLERDVQDAAVAIRDVVDNEMASAIRIITVEQGYDPRDFTLMGFGGAGPMHTCNVANVLNIDRVVFPNNSGLFSALGMIVSDIKHEYVQSLVELVSDLDFAEINGIIEDLIEKGVEELGSEGVANDEQIFTVTFDMMYSSQAHHLNVPLSGVTINERTLEGLIQSFENRHEAKYAFVDEADQIELVNVHVVAEGIVDKPDIGYNGDVSSGGEATAAGSREVVVDRSSTVEAEFYDWDALLPGHDLSGPAIVEMANSTVWLPPEFDAEIDDYKNVVARRSE